MKPTKSALRFFDTAQKGNGRCWGVPEADGSIDYWRGVVKARIGEAPESVIDSLGKYLDAYPDGMFADDAMLRLESAQARLSN